MHVRVLYAYEMQGSADFKYTIKYAMESMDVK